MQYFLQIDAIRYETVLEPALAACWRGQSFAPALDLCKELTHTARDFIQYENATPVEPVVLQVAAGLPFRRELWRLLIGEAIFFSAARLPELEIPLGTYAALLGQKLSDDRLFFPPIQQAVLGSRDVHFGAYYRSAEAGWNNPADVRRLAGWLAQIDPATWTVDRLASVDGSGIADCADDLAFAQEWFPALADLYRDASAQAQIVVSEHI